MSTYRAIMSTPRAIISTSRTIMSTSRATKSTSQNTVLTSSLLSTQKVYTIFGKSSHVPDLCSKNHLCIPAIISYTSILC